MTLKVDIINRAYSLLKISGLTVSPSSPDISLALMRLEDTMAEIYGDCLGYFYEDTPDANTPHNLDRKVWHSVSAVLADRLLPDFGKVASAPFAKMAGAAFSFLASNTALQQQTVYPSRQPIGSGNSRRLGNIQRFYYPEEQDFSCETHKMVLGDVSDFTESFTSYLRDGEDISSYVITSDDGVSVSGDTETDNIISYTVTATGPANAYYRVKIVVTTTDSRITTRFVKFFIESEEL